MPYTITISHESLIDLLQDHYDNKVYENINEGDTITDIQWRPYLDIDITIGENKEE